MDDEFLLRTRLGFVHSNVDRVKRVVEVIKTCKQHIDRDRAFLSDVKNQIGNVSQELRALLGKSEGQLADTLDELARDVDDVQRLVRKRTDEIGRIDSVLVELSKGGESAKSLLDGAEQEVNTIQENLLGGLQPAGWEQLRAVMTRSHGIFAEYVDLLAGLALRDIGFDDGVCRLADELFRSYRLSPGSVVRGLLSIPSIHIAMNRSWAPVIRLTFPEWSIWTLPLAAREHWFFARESLGAAKNIDVLGESLDVSKPAMQEALADAFGTVALGPAYAYAAILLGLDPSNAHGADGALSNPESQKRPAVPERSPHATDDVRAAAIFAALDELDPNKDGPRAFASIKNELQEQWERAIEATRPKGERDEVANRLIAKAVGRLVRLMREKGSSMMDGEQWLKFQTWPDLLRKGERIARGGAELRWVLNAAWLARVQVQCEKKGPDEVRAELEALKDQAKVLWDGVVSDRGGVPGSPGRMPPQNGG